MENLSHPLKLFTVIITDDSERDFFNCTALGHLQESDMTNYLSSTRVPGRPEHHRENKSRKVWRNPAARRPVT